jgi:pyruvate formate lyase activating enzyme
VTRELPIVGFHKLSLAHYEGKLSAVVIVPGCNFRCPFCPKEELVLHHQPMEKIPVEDVIDTLYPRMGFLDGVCITGGEPTLHRYLPHFAERLKSIGSLVKIETNGSRPRMIRILLERNLLDYITMDIIAPIEEYREVTRYKIKPDTIHESIHLIRRSNLDHEFRVKIVPGIIDEESLESISQTLAGSKRLVLNPFESVETLCPEYRGIEPPSDKMMKKLCDVAFPYFGECIIRR